MRIKLFNIQRALKFLKKLVWKLFLVLILILKFIYYLFKIIDILRDWFTKDS